MVFQIFFQSEGGQKCLDIVQRKIETRNWVDHKMILLLYPSQSKDNLSSTFTDILGDFLTLTMKSQQLNDDCSWHKIIGISLM